MSFSVRNMDQDENSNNSDSGDIVAYLRANTNGSKKRKRDEEDEELALGPKPKDRDEIELENMLFGDNTIVNRLGKELKHGFGAADELKLDLGDHGDLLDEDEIPEDEDDSEDEEDRKKRRKLDPSKVKPAWQDEDDENAVVNIVKQNRLRKLRTAKEEKEVSGKEYSDRLREQFNKINRHANLKWAQYQIVDEDPTLEMLRSTHSLVANKDKRKLEPKNIAIGRLKDANIQEPANAVIQSVKFHPNGQLLLTAGLDKKLRLFQIDGKENEKLQTVFFADLPLTHALFTPNGKEIIATGKDKHFYLYELMSGKVERVDQVIGRLERKWRGCHVSPDNQYICLLGDDGNVVVLSNKTKQWAFNMKMNGLVNNIAFSKDSKYMYSAGGKTNGEIYQWDLGTRRCVRRFVDEGSIYNTALTVSQNIEGHALMATGSDNGVVNMYDMADPAFGQSKNPKPIKAIMNLTTEINQVQFNHDAQLLAMSSTEKRNGFRLVHVPSCTVYENWPKEKTPLTRVSSFDFSPNSAMLAVGNVHGKVLLYKLHHYHQNK